MIDLHSHILPALCDGSQSLETSLAMARLAVADGTTHLACTPHIYPGVYDNSTEIIASALRMLQVELYSRDIPLRLVIGADVRLVSGVLEGLQCGTVPTLDNSRYFLLEPSHSLPVPHFLRHIEAFLAAGYVPVITHPERLRWCEANYHEFIAAAQMGAWLQVTAGAIAGTFGRTAKRCAERLLLDGVVHIIASDAHNVNYRPPILSAGVDAAIRITGDDTEIMRMVNDRPLAILDNIDPSEVLLPAGLPTNGAVINAESAQKPWLERLLG
ncbi:tyrosine-protein phosphatase [Thiothrix winogradskyi]|uniref:protein-tyrosine-phosphatase n=1 Tax=Thiothrix winogradskyi TaxID=96472 RepID=A0ABY3T410_9GAMM|nr:CpsB/CapC family capsule biosynthesis tyrosine phosphatase [Thiothrix winogradskyi]UJS26601.1 capsular biosynthesis protein [Thiothrix winogradskyi]